MHNSELLSFFGSNIFILRVQVLSPLHPREWTNGGISDVIINNLDPRGVMWQVIVILGCKFLHFWEQGSRDVGKVMMFVMVPNIKSELVQWSVVRVGLRVVLKHVVLRDEVSRNRVKAHPQQRPRDHVEEGLSPQVVNHCCIKYNLQSEIKHLEGSRYLGVRHERTEGVEKRLEKHPNGLAHGICKHFGFHFGGNICVEKLVALIFVVFQVITFEGHREWDSYWQVDENAESSVKFGLGYPEGQVVGYLVDCQQQRMIDSATDDVGKE